MIAGKIRNNTVEFLVLLALMFAYAADSPPMVNEAHYLVKAKNFWDSSWCAQDLFAASGKAHAMYYVVFGWMTQWLSLSTTAWICRWIGWIGIALGLMRLCHAIVGTRFASWLVFVIWVAGIEYANLAGEWVVGGTEAKVPAYGLLLFGIAALVNRQWNLVWVFFGAASAFHVLVGGWSVLAAMFAWWFIERGRPSHRLQQDAQSEGDGFDDDQQKDVSLPKRKGFWTWGLFVGGLLALLGLVPAIWLTLHAKEGQASAAAKVYVFVRISHHLLLSSFPIWWMVRHGCLIAVGALLLRGMVRESKSTTRHEAKWVRLAWFTWGAVAIAVLGAVIDFVPGLPRDIVARLLRYYWFRMTDVAAPLLLACLTAIVMAPWFGKGEQRFGRGLTVLAGVVSTASVIAFCWSTLDRSHLNIPPSASNRLLGWDASASVESQRQAYDDWLKVCDYIRETMPEDEVFLTPRHQQTFKWFAQRAEVVNFKDVPQDAAALLEWYKRFREVFPVQLGTMRVTIQYSKLREFRKTYGVRFMVVDRRIAGQHLPLVRVYPLDPEINDTYAVYELPPLGTEVPPTP